jgi:uncharacterized membrane protein YfcA
MSFLTILLLVASGFAAGLVNAVAGGGTFFTFPALMGAGLSSIAANASSTIAVWPGNIAGVIAARRELWAYRAHLRQHSLIALGGGLLGALLLLVVDDAAFQAQVPWLILFATLLFLSADPLITRLQQREWGSTSLAFRDRGLIALNLLVAIYGGYFGAGLGVMLMASLSFSGMRDMHLMIAVKNWIGMLVSLIALVSFTIAGLVHWHAALIVACGTILGGYTGARMAKRLSKPVLKRIVVAIGFLLSAYYFGKFS